MDLALDGYEVFLSIKILLSLRFDDIDKAASSNVPVPNRHTF